MTFTLKGCIFVLSITQKSETMEKITFLKNLEENGQNQSWAVINTSAIECIRLSETYDGYGQKCGAVASGDYIDLNEELCKLANNWELDNDTMKNTWNLGDFVSAYENPDLFDYLVEQGAETEGEEVLGFTYHNGNNFKTVILEQDNSFVPQWQIETDETVIRSLTAALAATKNFYYTGAWGKSSRGKKYKISQSFSQSCWEKYTIEKL